jgi:hypothetical protein
MHQDMKFLLPASSRSIPSGFAGIAFIRVSRTLRQSLKFIGTGSTSHEDGGMPAQTFREMDTNLQWLLHIDEGR